ncbi:heme peroxidase [Bisporella sp. PMI_857]|nr:heme peroxidase [Bisporella sp. PMI_857]
MHCPPLLLAAVISDVYAISFADIGTSSIHALKRVRDVIPSFPVLEERKAPACPAVWTNVVADLRTMFLDTTTKQCNDDARAAIRAAFHDCGTWDKSQGATGGCDGSLILANEASTRAENNGLQDISAKLLNLQKTKYPSVTVADLIQVASSVAIVTCPGGPVVKTFVGRKDSAVPNPGGRLPDVHAPGSNLFKLFQDKGFNAVDLAALLGAHSTSKAFGQPDIPGGTPQDSTPGVWDVKYYQETLTPPSSVQPFASDVSLAAHPDVGKEFKGFVNNQGKWTGKFADAMLRMSLLGVPGSNDPSKNLIDCTGVIPRSTNVKREMRAAPINDRIR